MSTATSGDFLGGGGEVVDPFKGRAPMTLAEQAAAEDAKRARQQQDQRASDARVANTNRAADVDPSRSFNTGSTIDPHTGMPMRPKTDPFVSTILPTLEAIAKDPVTLGVLAAPYLIAGPVAGAASAGSAATAGGAGAASATPAITTGGAVTEASIAAPVAAGAATAAPAAGGAIAAGSSIPGWVAPVAGGIAAAGADYLIGQATSGRTDEEKKLVAKQEQLAAEAEQRRYAVQEQHMNALGQQLLAFNPRNQMMASMFGPGAAFAPTDFAQMVQNPAPPPQMPPELQSLQGQAANNPEAQAKLKAFFDAQRQYEAGNQQRSDMMMNSMAPAGPGPAPLQVRAPQAARKY